MNNLAFSTWNVAKLNSNDSSYVGDGLERFTAVWYFTSVLSTSKMIFTNVSTLNSNNQIFKFFFFLTVLLSLALLGDLSDEYRSIRLLPLMMWTNKLPRSASYLSPMSSEGISLGFKLLALTTAFGLAALSARPGSPARPPRPAIPLPAYGGPLNSLRLENDSLLFFYYEKLNSR